MMKIGQLSILSPVIQAPLAGYSCAPFRKLAWEWGRPGFCCTEMLSAKNIACNQLQRQRYTVKDPLEKILCFQLSGNDAETLKIAADKVLAWGADLIDLNCGCPQPKIRKKQQGSRLLTDAKKLYQLICAIKSNTQLPVLVKIRVDGGSGDTFNASVAKAVEEAGADALTVHGRHWRDSYETPCKLSEIAEMVQAVAIPVIGNGDVVDTISAKNMLENTDCDAVMLARASVGQPWLSAEIAAGLLGKAFIKPSILQIAEMFLQHVRELILLEGETQAILQARKLGKYYAREHCTSDFLARLYQVQRYQQLQALVDECFNTAYLKGEKK